MKAGDVFIAVKNRIQKLLEIPEKEYEKFKFALVHLNKPQYIEMAQMQSFSINLNDLNGKGWLVEFWAAPYAPSAFGSLELVLKRRKKLVDHDPF